MSSRIDLHLHTTRYSPDSIITPEQLLIDARTAGLTAVAITEHDAIWTPDELAEINARPEAAGLLVLSGVEVSAREGHFLCFGLPDMRNVEPGILLKHLIAEVQGQGGAIVAAHPYRWDQDFDPIFAAHHAAFSALELASKNVDTHCRTLVEGLVRNGTKSMLTGSSDGHEPGQVGCYFTEFESEIRSMPDLIQALRQGNFRPRNNLTGLDWQWSGPILN